MSRLTNRGTNGEIWITDNDETRQYGRKETAFKKLADYEDKEEQGLIISLPCKVGDTVYQMWKNADGFYVKPWKVSTLTWLVQAIEDGLFGKTWFLTEAEAEEALAKMGGK